MACYECLFTSGRQFVFAEQSGRRWLATGMLAIALMGLLVGLGIGVTISIAGLYAFQMLMIVFCCFSMYHSYVYMFESEASSSDWSSYIIGCCIFFCLVCIMLFGVHACVNSDISDVNRNALFSVVGILGGVVFWAYHQLVLREDERKHHLGPCGRDGLVAEHLGLDAASGGGLEVVHEGGSWDELLRFMVWVLSWRWWSDITHSPTALDEESCVTDCITVHNRTLKKIKVCFYSPDDLFCWVPFGGVSGKSVAFIQTQEQCTFNLKKRARPEAVRAAFQLKVFQPGVFDKELACIRRACCGQSFVFSDVEGMVRRSRALSSPLCKAAQKVDVCGAAAESSEEECLTPTIPGLLSRSGSGMLTRSGSGMLTRSGSGMLARSCSGMLRRAQRLESASTAASLCGMGEDTPGGSTSPMPQSLSPLVDPGLSGSPRRGFGGCGLSGSPRREALRPQRVDTKLATEGWPHEPAARPSAEARARRAAPEEIVVRNKSNQDILVKLFRSADVVFLVALSGSAIAPHAEHRFDTAQYEETDYTCKVYSVGPGARELTYLTVSRGDAYNFCDSLLS